MVQDKFEQKKNFCFPCFYRIIETRAEVRENEKLDLFLGSAKPFLYKKERGVNNEYFLY